jgi:hypothetical protein
MMPTDRDLKEVKKAIYVQFRTEFPTPSAEKCGKKALVIDVPYETAEAASDGLKELFDMVDYHTARYEIDALKDARRALSKELDEQMLAIEEYTSNDKIEYQRSERKGEYKMSNTAAQNMQKMMRRVKILEIQMDYYKDEIETREATVKEKKKLYQKAA